MPAAPRMDERVSSRARRAIQRSSELIRRSGALLAENRAFLRRLEPLIKENQWIQSDSDLFSGDPDQTLSWIMDSATQITRANMANIQLVDPDSGSLRIAAQHGFSHPFLEYFERVHEGEAACGQAMGKQKRVLVEDVTKSPIFRHTPALEVLLDAGVRAVQSTPLISSAGSLIGIVSTHWTSPRTLNNEELLQLDILGRTAADYLALY